MPSLFYSGGNRGVVMEIHFQKVKKFMILKLASCISYLMTV